MPGSKWIKGNKSFDRIENYRLCRGYHTSLLKSRRNLRVGREGFLGKNEERKIVRIGRPL